MYFSKFHKQVFKAIEKQKIIDLETFLEKFINELPHYKGKLYSDGTSIGFKGSIFENFTFSGFETDKNGSKKFVVTTKESEEKIYVLFQELVMILDFLEANSLITLKEKDLTGKKCLAIYKMKKDPDTEEKSSKSMKNEYESFDDVLVLIRKYINKKIIIRKGFAKFAHDNYKTPEERMKVLSTIKIPLIALTLSIFVAPSIPFIFNNYVLPKNDKSNSMWIKSYPLNKPNKTDSTKIIETDSLMIYAIYIK